MKFINEKENKCKFGDLDVGDYFRDENELYIKASIEDEDGVYCAINLETGNGYAMPSDITVTAIEVTKIFYRDD